MKEDIKESKDDLENILDNEVIDVQSQKNNKDLTKSDNQGKKKIRFK